MNNNFLIGTIDNGIQKNIKPWAIINSAFDTLINMYQWRGRVVRKPPYSLLGQLSFVIATQFVGNSAQNFTANLFSVFGLSGVTIVPNFTTIAVDGAGVYTLKENSNSPGTIIQTSGSGNAFLNGSINYLTGALALNFSSNPSGTVVITFSYAYALPVMGLRTRELFEINQQDTIGFDTMFSYRYSNTSGQFVPLASVMPVVWSGADWQFFYTTNYAGSFWATNSNPGLNGQAIANITKSATPTVTTINPHGFTTGQTVVFINVAGMTQINGLSAVITVTGSNTFTLNISTSAFSNYSSGGMALNAFFTVPGQDGIRYYGALTNGTGWANYNPPVDTSNALAGALLIFPYRGYLVFLNTTEGNENGVFNYGNRARWTQVGTPYYSQPVPSTPNPQGIDVQTSRDDLFGKGGANDAPTQEVIVGATFIRDILIVFFERSCWRLRFVNNAQNPFVWERINVELGSSATFSTIPFDKGAMAIGERGIVIADANDVARIDDLIPDQIFNIRIQNDGMQRVYGIRTFRTKLNYWIMPSDSNPNGIYPDMILVYNYETKTWATFDDSFTCFGYFYQFNDLTWADLTAAWSTYDELTWGGGEIEQGYEQIIAGNQQGFVLALENDAQNVQPNPVFENGASLMVQGIVNGSLPSTPSTFSSLNNNLPNGSWIVLSGVAGTTDITGVTLNGRNFKVANPSLDPTNFSLQEFTPIDAGSASGTTFTYNLANPFIPVFPGSVYITVGSITFTDNALNGVLTDLNGSLSTGIIDYKTGAITLFFVPSISSTEVYIRVVSQNPAQGFSNVITNGTYTGGGYISRTSNFQIKTKIFNFLDKDERARLSRIDFYMNATQAGEFTVDVLSDSSNQPVNTPLTDNPRQNVVRTIQGQYQFGIGEEVIYRLYADAIGQTLQANMYLSDQQMAVPSINSANVELLAMNWSLRPGGRLI